MRRLYTCPAVLLLLICLTAWQQQAAAQSVYQSSFSGLSCGDLGARIAGKAITVRPQRFCQSFGLERPSLFGCTLLDVVEDAAKRVRSECLPHQQVEVSAVTADGKPIPAPLPDRRPLPAGSFPDQQAVLKQEGGTMYWFITNIVNMELWAACKPIASFTTPWKVPKGWQLLNWQTTPEGPGQKYLPMSAVIKQSSSKALAVIIRGTVTATEWAEDFTYMQVKDAAFPGLVEKGFRDAAAVIWPGIQKALQSEVVQGSGTAVTIGGHSLGAALATLIAYQAQVYLDAQLKQAGKPPVAVSALLFAPPNVGDPTFVQAYNKLVNTRRIAHAVDVVPQVPCAPQMMACRRSPLPSFAPGVSSWAFQPVGGHITFQPGSMPVQAAAWQQLTTVNGCQLIPWTIASHVCSYPCFFAQFGPPGAAEQHGRCKLRGARRDTMRRDDPAYCVGFPKYDPEFPLLQPPSKLVYGQHQGASDILREHGS